MPKLYYPTPDELQGAEPLNELVWFERHQNLLVKLANTDWGRDLLLIDKHPYPVVAIGKNYVRFHLGVWDDQDHWMSDCRIGGKWGNIIRYRWLAVKKAMDRVALLDILSWQSLGGRTPAHAYRFTTTTVYPDAHAESTSVDGYATEQTNAVWGTIRGDSGDGSVDTGTDMEVNVGYGTTNWDVIDRGITLFDISSIGGGDAIGSATHSFNPSVLVNNFTDSLSLVVSAPASDTAIAPGDYDSLGDVIQAANLAVSGISTSEYNVFTANATMLTAIAAATAGDGILKQGYRCTIDQSNNEPGSPGNGHRTLVRVSSADTTDTAKDPKLIILHTSTFTPKVMMF